MTCNHCGLYYARAVSLGICAAIPTLWEWWMWTPQATHDAVWVASKCAYSKNFSYVIPTKYRPLLLPVYNMDRSKWMPLVYCTIFVRFLHWTMFCGRVWQWQCFHQLVTKPFWSCQTFCNWWKVVVLQPLRWCCVECVIHHERDVREEQHHTLLPQYEALRICRSGFPIATKWCCDQDVKVVRSSAFTQRTCNRCGSM